MFGSRLQRKLKKLDISSTYAYVVGIGAILISCTVALVTLYKLVVFENTRLIVAILVSLAVYYVFSEIYSILVMFGLRFFEEKEDKL
jgi:hypothetical protein